MHSQPMMLELEHSGILQDLPGTRAFDITDQRKCRSAKDMFLLCQLIRSFPVNLDNLGECVVSATVHQEKNSKFNVPVASRCHVSEKIAGSSKRRVSANRIFLLDRPRRALLTTSTVNNKPFTCIRWLPDFCFCSG